MKLKQYWHWQGAFLFFIIVAGGFAAGANRRLVLFGGGDYIEPGIRRFMQWSGKTHARIVVSHWASESMEHNRGFEEEIAKYKPASITELPSRKELSGKKDLALKLIAEATGIFFTGGDQALIMEALKDTQIREALISAYFRGTVFGGTSAGTAIMSELMITGTGSTASDGSFITIDPKGVNTASGLGLLRSVIVDQHFLERRRQNRLLSVLLAHPRLGGLGIDRSSAVAITDESDAEVLGGGYVSLFLRSDNPEDILLRLIPEGKKFKLSGR